MLLTGLIIGGGTAFAGLKYAQSLETAPALHQNKKGLKPQHGKLPVKQATTSADSENTLDPVQHKLDQNLSLAAGSLGLSVLGGLYSVPALTILSLPGFFYISKHVFDDARRHWCEGNGVGVDALSLLVKGMLFINGQYILCNLSATSHSLNRKLLYTIKDNSKKSVIDVFRQHPRNVFILKNEVEIEIPFEELSMGDLVIVHAGEMIPADGSIVSGHATIDQHILTGESQPAEKSTGDEVFAMTVVLSGSVHICVEKAGEETTAAQIGKILNQTVNCKTQMQLKVEAITNRTILPTLIVAGITLPLNGLMGTTAFMYAHPKYKTIITGAINVLSSLNQATRCGILIKDGRTFDLLNDVDTVVFDKTGTLTLEQPHVGQIHTFAQWTEQDVLYYAASAEYKQTHPIARAILDKAKSAGLQPGHVQNAAYKVGHGIKVTLDDASVRVGSTRFIRSEEIDLPPELSDIQAHCHDKGHSLILVARDGQVIGAIELHATLRPEVSHVVQGLRERGIQSIYIISGDHEAPTRHLANELGIDHYFAETLPEQKADLINQLQQSGQSVCYIGDGINDSIALKTAHVSVSLQGASTVATDTAQVVLMDQSLENLCTLFDLSREFEHNMKRAMLAVIAPHAIALGGSLFFKFGFLASFVLVNIGLLGGVSVALLPLLRQQGNLLPLPGQPNQNHAVDDTAQAHRVDTISPPTLNQVPETEVDDSSNVIPLLRTA